MNVNLSQLHQELVAAGVSVAGLGIFEDRVVTYGAGGAMQELPSEAAPVVAAHVPVDPIEATSAARRAAIATVLNNTSILSAGHEAERDAWCDLLGAQRLSRAQPPIPSTQAVAADDIVLADGD